MQRELSAYTRSRRLCVYNFGARLYYSTQERIFLEQLLVQGCKSDIAIFLDGLNDFWHINDRPTFPREVDVPFRQNYPVSALVHDLPVSRVVSGFLFAAGEGRSQPAAALEEIQAIIARYERNKLLIESACSAFGITSVFVWQPVPTYKYDLSKHLFFNDQLRPVYVNQAPGYAEMERVFKSGKLGENFLWCADLQEEEKECVYVDDCHYTAKFSEKLAAAIVRLCLERRLLEGHGVSAHALAGPVPTRSSHTTAIAPAMEGRASGGREQGVWEHESPAKKQRLFLAMWTCCSQNSACPTFTICDIARSLLRCPALLNCLFFQRQLRKTLRSKGRTAVSGGRRWRRWRRCQPIVRFILCRVRE